MQITKRPHFLALRQNSCLTSQQVAQEAGLSLSEEYRAEIGSAVEPAVAERVRAACSRLTDKAWTLDELAIITRKGVSR